MNLHYCPTSSFQDNKSMVHFIICQCYKTLVSPPTHSCWWQFHPQQNNTLISIRRRLSHPKCFCAWISWYRRRRWLELSLLDSIIESLSQSLLPPSLAFPQQNHPHTVNEVAINRLLWVPLSVFTHFPQPIVVVAVYVSAPSPSSSSLGMIWKWPTPRRNTTKRNGKESLKIKDSSLSCLVILCRRWGNETLLLLRGQGPWKLFMYSSSMYRVGREEEKVPIVYRRHSHPITCFGKCRPQTEETCEVVKSILFACKS